MRPKKKWKFLFKTRMGKNGFVPIALAQRRPMNPSHLSEPLSPSICASLSHRFPMRQNFGRDRLDRALVLRGFADSREQAAQLILSGQVLVNGIPADKLARQVS